MDRVRVEKLFNLSRKRLPLKYMLKKTDSPVILRDTSKEVPLLFNSKNGNIEAFQAHSNRSAILYHPFEEDGRWFFGYEYKGVGLKGKGIEDNGGRLWGGVESHAAVREFEWNKKAFNSGALSQKPVMVYKAGNFFGKEAAVFVRAVSSPIRLIDFTNHKSLLQEYLEITGETEEQYAKRLGLTVGKSMKLMFDNHLSKDTMEIDNTTSEGEMMDFERLYTGESKEQEVKVRCFSLRKFLYEVNLIFKNTMDDFLDGFSQAFVGKQINFSNDPGKQLLEDYMGEAFTEEQVKFVYEEPIRSSVIEGLKVLKEVKEEFLKKKGLSHAEKEVLEAINGVLDSPFSGV
jgi:hypothetical protein